MEPELGRRLFAACSEGKIDTVKYLLDHEKLREERITDSATLHGIINQQYENRGTPLFVAAKRGYFEIVQILLRHHADVNSVNGDEESTALIVAIQGGHQDIVQLLLECEGIHPNVQTKTKKWSALMFACERGQTNTVKMLLKKGAEVRMGDNKETALMIACGRGYTKIAELLLEYGAIHVINLLAGSEHVESRTGLHPKEYNLPHRNALMLASGGGHTKTVELLLTYGATVNIQSEEDGWSALMFASEKGCTEIAELLLKYGAEVDLLGVVFNNMEPSYYHTKYNRDPIAQTMLKGAAEKDIMFYTHLDDDPMATNSIWTTKGAKWTSLMIASKNGHAKTVKLLVEYGANVNMQSEGHITLLVTNEQEHHADTGFQATIKGMTALMISSWNRSYETVKLLLDHGANVNMQSEDDRWSALMLASFKGYTEIAELLLEYGAEVDLFGSVCDVEPIVKFYHDPAMLHLSQKHSTLEDKNQWTALMLASANGHKETATILLKYGANVDIQPGGPWTALLLASKNKHIEMVQLLLLHGAKVNMQGNTAQKHDYMWTALTLSSRNGHTEVIEILLKHGASEVSSALLAAAQLQEKKIEVIELLLKHGANINFQNNEGTSALMLASNKKVTELLLKHGANVNLQNNKGTSALMFASQNVRRFESHLKWDSDHQLEVVRKIIGIAELLLMHGADINLQNNEGISTLMLAVQEHFPNMELFVEMLLKHGANVNLQNNKGWSALMFASWIGKIGMMILLLKHRASVYLRTIPNGMSALMIASEKGKDAAVQLLLKNGADINALNGDGCSALILANRNQHKGIAQRLLEYGAKEHTKALDDEPWLTLMIACENGLTERVQQLLEQGVDVNKVNEDDRWSALMIVCRNGCTKIAEILLNHGASMDMQNNNGWPAIMIACQYGHYEIVKVLLQHGAWTNMLYQKKSPLMIAAQYGHYETVRRLVLEDRANVNLQNSEGTSALMISVQNECAGVTEILLELKADINMQNNGGLSALMFAGLKGDTKAVKVLLEYGANVNLQNKNGWTALMLTIAGLNVSLEVVKLFLIYGGDTNLQGNDGWSALMLACQNQYTEITRLLLEYGADVNMKNKFNGLTALMIASRDGAIKTVELLLEHGANVNLKDINGLSALEFASKSQLTEIVKLLVECEAIAAKFSPTVLLIEDLSAETTIKVTNSEQHFSWLEYGLHLDIPQNSLPEDVEQCVIRFKVSISGDYQLPQDVHLVSAVYSIKCVPKFQFSKLVTLKIQHCAKQENLHKLCFVRSPKAGSSFQIFPSKNHSQNVNCIFSYDSTYCFIKLDRFCGVTAALMGSRERDYRANIYRRVEDARSHNIYFTILWNINAHDELVSEYYREKNIAFDHDQRIVFEENQIKLDVPFPSSVGISTENKEWRILSVTPPLITKMEVDMFEKGKRIPSCQLLAMCEGETQTHLAHPVKLTGAKDPYNVFMICISSHGSVKRTELSSITGQDRTKFDKPPNLDELIVLKYTQRGERKKIRILTEARHKWKDIAGLICGDTNIISVLEQKYLNADPYECLRHIVIENFISKKPQGYSQDWNGLIELLDDVDLGNLVEKIKHALSHT